jgi:hypothetical protein
MQEIHKITGIPVQALQGRPLSQFSVKERLSWTTGRSTSREEDAAYCLLGIFGVYMPTIYGEGRENAFRRLLKEIKSYSFSEDSSLQYSHDRFEPATFLSDLNLSFFHRKSKDKT